MWGMLRTKPMTFIDVVWIARCQGAQYSGQSCLPSTILGINQGSRRERSFCSRIYVIELSNVSQELESFNHGSTFSHPLENSETYLAHHTSGPEARGCSLHVARRPNPPRVLVLLITGDRGERLHSYLIEALALNKSPPCTGRSLPTVSGSATDRRKPRATRRLNAGSPHLGPRPARCLRTCPARTATPSSSSATCPAPTSLISEGLCRLRTPAGVNGGGIVRQSGGVRMHHGPRR